MRRRWQTAPAAALLCLLVLPMAGGCVRIKDVVASITAADERPVASRIRNSLSAQGDELAAFYAARAYRPVWVDGSKLRPEVRELLDLLDGSDREGLPSEMFGSQRLRTLVEQAASGGPEALARADIALSRAYAAYAVARHSPMSGTRMLYTDKALPRPSLTPRAALDQLSRARSLRTQLAAVRQTNPIYDQLREGLAAYRARWSGLPDIQVPTGPDLQLGDRGARVDALRTRLGLPQGVFDAELRDALTEFQAAHGLKVSGRLDARTVAALNAGFDHHERLIRANLERARGLPADPGQRFVLVDAAAATLYAYEDGRLRDTMRVIVGKPSQPTPEMVGVIRYAVFNPYWNVPEDMARDSIAPRVLREGVSYFTDENFEALSDWSDGARVLDPHQVDWRAVASGRQPLRVRQRPGPWNMMGRVKLMLPNELGIYLHDTPKRALFAEDRRNFSAGCIRLQDAARLTRWLLGDAPGEATASDEELRVDLARPTPVYIAYFTVAPSPHGLVFRDDVYGRDPGLLASLDAARGEGGVKALARRVSSAPAS
jgi:murein L,D-transpeptidase YcbB/YkuD